MRKFSVPGAAFFAFGICGFSFLHVVRKWKWKSENHCIANSWIPDERKMNRIMAAHSHFCTIFMEYAIQGENATLFCYVYWFYSTILFFFFPFTMCTRTRIQIRFDSIGKCEYIRNDAKRTAKQSKYLCLLTFAICNFLMKLNLIRHLNWKCVALVERYTCFSFRIL